MKKVLFFLSVLLVVVSANCMAIDHSSDRSSNLPSLSALSRETATPQSVTAMLGEPTKIEQNKKRIWWHYTSENTQLTVCWNKKSNQFETFSFTSESAEKPLFDTRLASKLHSGSTDILQAMKLLGTPNNMKIKDGTQEMHYAFQNSVLRLFFRNRVLVDYTLLGQAGK